MKFVTLTTSVILLMVMTKTLGAGTDYKRILLNDPDTEERLNQMDRTIKALTKQLTQLNAKVDAQETELKLHKSSSNIYMGSTYIRWGRTVCPGPNTTLVYSGFTTGQNYKGASDTYGGPANFLCLPSDPELTNITLNGYSFLYGTEYLMNSIKSDAVLQDVPCSLCKSSHSAVVMIPGRRTCYPGWNVEYTGLIASDYYGYTASSYICVDSNPDYIQGGEADQPARELYYTQTKCGALQCPPYKDKQAVNCVVCSQ